MIKNSVATNNGFFFVALKEWKEREQDVFQILKEVNGKVVFGIPEATVFAFGPPPITGIGNAAGFSMMLQDREGNTPQYLFENAQQFMAEAKKRPEIGTIRTTFNPNVPQISLDIDREKVTELNLSLSDVNIAIGASLGGQYINEFNKFGRQYIVLLQADPSYTVNPEDINKIFVRSKDNKMIPISSIATIRKVSGPEFTTRFNLYRAAEIGGTPAPGFTSAQAMNALQETASKVLPAGMGYEWANMSYQEKQAEGKGNTVFLMALLFVFGLILLVNWVVS